MPNLHRDQRGVAAIEFAIVLPLLLLLVVGMLEFSRAWSVTATVSGAARAAARSYAIHADPAIATQEAIDNGINVDLSGAGIDIRPGTGCVAGQTAQVTITYQLDYLTGMFGNSLTITGEGMYPCQG